MYAFSIAATRSPGAAGGGTATATKELLVDYARRGRADGERPERSARAIVEALALAAQASLMKRYADAGAAEAFCASRLDAAAGGRTLGTLPADTDCAALVRRAALRA